MSQSERTLVLVKPEAFRRGLTGEVIRRIEAKGYELEALAVVTADEAKLREHYAEHVHKHFFSDLVEYMSSGPMTAIVVRGERCIEGMRVMAGSPDPTPAPAGTLRGDFGRDWGSNNIENVVHCSDSPTSAEREIKIWF